MYKVDLVQTKTKFVKNA